MLVLFTFSDLEDVVFEVSAEMGATLLASWKAFQIETSTPVPDTFLTQQGEEFVVEWPKVRAILVKEQK